MPADQRRRGAGQLEERIGQAGEILGGEAELHGRAGKGAGDGEGAAQLAAGYEADGSARITERAHAALVKYMNYDCPVLRPAEVEERAEELVAKLNEAARVAA